ncbi:MAG TPA: hypothetical protein VFN09_14830 [Rhodanobacteraceae bacterium]|nr:hypothetical protein [Rhodanobacteraceae bacterium]
MPFRYAWPLDRLESRFKFSADLACGRTLARLWCAQTPPAERPTRLIPIPLHTTRLRQRGYNQALELARPVAAAFGLQLDPRSLLRTRATTAQTTLDRAARLRNLRGAFVVRAGTTLPSHVALLDDVMTTGATLAAATRALRLAGVSRVEVWALARAPAPRG